MVKRLPVTASSNAVVLQMARSRTIARYWGTTGCLAFSFESSNPDMYRENAKKQIRITRICEFILGKDE